MTLVFVTKSSNVSLGLMPRVNIAKKNANLPDPSEKTLRDRFNLFVRIRKAENRRNAAVSGIVEEHKERHILLDDIISQIDAVISECNATKEALLPKEKRLCVFPETIRASALNRQQRKRVAEDDDGSAAKKSKRELILIPLAIAKSWSYYAK